MAPESLSKKIGIVRVDPNERIGSPAAQAPDPRQRALSRAVAVGALVAHLCLLYGITRLDLTYAIPRKKSLEIPVELVTGLPGDDKGGKGGAGQKKSADKAKGLPPAPKVAQKQANPAPKAEVKNEPKPESKPAPKEEAKLEPKPAPKPPAQPSPKPEAKPEPKPEAAKPPAPKPQLAKPEAPKPEAKPAPKPPPAKAEAKPLKPAPEPSPKQTAEAKPAPPKSPAEPKPPAPKPAEAKPPVAAAKPPPPPPPPAPTLPALATLSPTLGPASQQLMADTGHAASQTNLPAAGPRVPQMSENFTAVAVPSPTQDGDLLTAYKTLVFSKLELAKKFPEDARKRHAHGSAIVAFAIDAQGHVLRVTLLQSSGDTELDVASLALVQRAAPFPPPPPGAQREFAAVVEFDASH